MWWSLVFENVTNVYTNWFYIYGGHEFLNDDHTHTLAHTHNVNVGFCLCQKEKNWHSKKLLVDQSKKKNEMKTFGTLSCKRIFQLEKKWQCLRAR